MGHIRKLRTSSHRWLLPGRKYFRSLVRDAKDPARMFNFWRTASTELVALAPDLILATGSINVAPLQQATRTASAGLHDGGSLQDDVT